MPPGRRLEWEPDGLSGRHKPEAAPPDWRVFHFFFAVELKRAKLWFFPLADTKDETF
jgi:hypothetical protein